MQTILTVVAAVLRDADARVLVQRRPAHKEHGGLWEFPGGKVEPGEAPGQALVREILEELTLEIEPGAVAPLSFATRNIEGGTLVLLLYDCHRWAGTPIAHDADEIAWIDASELKSLAMPPADRELARAVVAGRP